MSESKGRILFVDDDADTCEMLSFFLDRAGFQVTVAFSVADGLKLAAQEEFDLYLLDLRFSDGDGIGLCEQIRAFDSKTPVVVYSGDVRESVQNEARKAGVQHFLRKPVPLADLYEVISRLAGKDRYLNSICA